MIRRIGIDVGGTKCLGVLIDDECRVIAEVRVPTPQHDRLIDTLVAMVGDLGPADHVGIGVPGLITRDGVIRSSPNLAGALNLSIQSPLREALRSEVRVANDATCAALGEWTCGAAVGLTNFVMVTLGTGIGGGIVINGSLVYGAQGFAGEIGHMVVSPQGTLCGCGKRGCWERYASGTAFAQAVGVDTGEEAFARVHQQDEAACAALREWSRWVGAGLANLVNIVDPEAFVLGGGVIDHADAFIGLVEEHMTGAVYAAAQRRVARIRVAQLGSKAGAIGAALLTRD